jgi:SAM-dependent methyltransferase
MVIKRNIVMKNYIAVNKHAYDNLCDEYNKRALNKSEYEEKVEVLCGHILKYCEGNYGHMTFLEVGPGSGEALSYFEQKNFKTVAVELSAKMAAVAKNRSPNSIFIINNILKTKFLENQFDVIYAGALIHLFPFKDAQCLIKLFRKWLKPCGLLFINTTINKLSEEGFCEKIDYDKPVLRFRRKWTKEELRCELNRVDLRIIDSIFTDEKDRNKKWIAFICKK